MGRAALLECKIGAIAAWPRSGNFISIDIRAPHPAGNLSGGAYASSRRADQIRAPPVPTPPRLGNIFFAGS
jgi:hypothetical protein